MTTAAKRGAPMGTDINFDEICPPFCEFEAHENTDTDEAPFYLHGTEDHVVHGFRLRIVMGSDETGAEHPEEPLCITVNEEILSLSEARDLAGALDAYIHQASLAHAGFSLLWELNQIRDAVTLASELTKQNHQKHLDARAARRPGVRALR